MSAILTPFFKLLDSLTAPLKGHRTQLAAAGFAIALLLAVWSGDFAGATTNLLALLAVLGLRLPAPVEEADPFLPRL